MAKTWKEMVGEAKQRVTLVSVDEAKRLTDSKKDILVVDVREKGEYVKGHILGADKTRLSKRHGATSTLAYREMGYLPEEKGLKLSQLAQPLRVALTGRTVSPGIYDVMEILGKERTLARLKKALEGIERLS